MNTCIIGGGKISEQHLNVLKGIDVADVVAISDLSPAMAEFNAGRYGIEKWYTDYRMMLKKNRTDVVHVLTPPATHDSIVRYCIEAGCNVIVEKPIALSNKLFKDLHCTAEAKGVKLIENHNYRFNTPVRQLERFIADKRIGEVKEAEIRMSLNIRGGGRYADSNLPHASHSLPAGVLHEFITHLSYLLLLFMPSDFLDRLDVVNAAWRNHGGGELFKYDDLDALLIADDYHGRIRFTSQHWPDAFSISLRGTNGTAFAELYNPICRITEHQSGGAHLTPLINSIKTAKTIRRSGYRSIWNKVKNVGAYEGLGEFLTQAYAALDGKNDFPVTYDQMEKTSRLIDMLLSEENRI